MLSAKGQWGHTGDWQSQSGEIPGLSVGRQLGSMEMRNWAGSNTGRSLNSQWENLSHESFY